MNLQVRLLGYIPEVERIIAAGTKATRSKPTDDLLGGITLEEARSLVGRIVAQGHEGIVEFAFFIFSVSGVSRVLTHQLVRHRIASYLQLSSREVDLSKSDFVVPHSIEDNADAKKIFSRVIDFARSSYNKLLRIGIPKEDARYLLPDSIETHILIGMNARSLNNFFGLRLCKKAQWEIRELADKMRKLVKDKFPSLFWSEPRPCVIRGICPQRNTCGFSKTNEFKREREKYLRGYPRG